MADYVDEGLKKVGISISKPVLAAVCIVSGILVILFPSLVSWIVGLFLVVQGALLLTDYFEQEGRWVPETTTSKGVYCSSCGARNSVEAVYCKNCGKKLLRTEQVVRTQPAQPAQPPQKPVQVAQSPTT